MSADGPELMNYAQQRGDGEFNVLRPQRFADFAAGHARTTA